MRYEIQVKEGGWGAGNWLVLLVTVGGLLWVFCK